MKTYPLLQSQLGIFMQCIQNPQSTQYNLPSSAFIPPTVDIERLIQAMEKVISIRPTFRTRFMIDKNGDIRQWSDDKMVIAIVRRQCTEAELQSYVANEFVRPFDLLSGEPLFRIEYVQTEKGWWQLMDGHHSIMDGMSFTPVLVQIDINKAYMGEELSPLPYGLYEAAEDEVATFGTPVYEKAKAYYAEKFAGMELATLSNSTPGSMGKMIRRSAFVDQPACDAWCKEHGVAVNLLFQAAFSYVLAVLLRQDKVAYYTVNHGRMDKRLREAYGMFVKSVPVLADASGEKTVKDFVMSFRSELMSSIRYGCYPFTHFLKDLKLSSGISFNFQALVDMEECIILGDQRLYGTQPVRAEIDDDITVFIFYNEGKYEIRGESSSAMNSEETLQMVVDAIHQTLFSMEEHFDDLLSEVRIVSDQQQAQLMELSAGKQLDVDVTKTFAQAFEERAKLVPDHVAVADRDSHLTYQQLSHYSDVLAHQLIAAGVKPNDFVCVMLDRFKEFPLSVLAIHKAGAAYTPMDFEYPNERLQYMLENSESKVLITSHAVLESKQQEGDFDTANVQVIYMEDVDFSVKAEPVNLTTPDNLAYMIYTSGSTGKPKGAMLHQAGLWNFINVVIDMEKLTADDRIEGHRSFSFDAHIEDMYAILTLGGSFHIMPTEIRKDLAAIRDFLFQHQITGGGYSTAIGALLLNTYDDLPVRFITAGGEKLDGVYSDHVEIINVYGPTECTDDTSYYIIKPGTRVNNIPIGKPVANTWNFIVDAKGQLVPRGVVGELCIAGVQVGCGYWRLPERTAQSFVDCPFITEDRWGRKVRMYHTGDLCRWNDQGDLEYMGRIDFQVKIRGFRIELGEIESKVLGMEGIKQTAAEVRKINGIDHLLLYYTLEEGSTVTDEDIRQGLEASSLADYMVPDTYVKMDTMPLTPNGKVNRKVLPIPEIKSNIAYVEPANDTARIIAETFREVLQVDDQVGALNSFFEYGGDSVKAIRLVSMLRNKGVTVTVSAVMKEKTVQAIAASANQVQTIEIDQNEWSGRVENSAIEQFFFDLALPVPNHYNQSMMLKTTGRFDKSALEAALGTLTTHHDMLRAVVRDGALFVREVGDGPMFTIEEQAIDSQDKVAVEAAVNKLQGSIDITHGPLMKLALMHDTENDYLLIVIHHTVIDGVSWRILLEDLATTYGQALEGKPLSLSAKTHSYRYYREAMERFKKSSMLAAEKDYWEKVKAEVATSVTSAGTDYSRSYISKQIVVDAGITASLLAVPTRLENVGMNDLLLTALMRSYAAMMGKKKMAVLVEGTGRENIGEPLYTDRTIGWFTSMYPVVLQQDGDDLVANLASVKDVLHRVPNNGVGYGQLYGMDVATVPQVTFNYLGTFGGEVQNESQMTIAEDMPSGDYVAKANNFGSDIILNCMVLPSGQFEIMLDCNEATLNRSQAEAFLQRLATEIKTIGEAKIQEEELLTASDLGETTWTREEFKAVADDFASRGETLKRIYPLTPMQEGMVLKAVMEPDSVAYRIVFAVQMDALPTEQQLRSALDALAARHEVLRTAVIVRGASEYRQAIVEGRQLGLQMMDITGAADQEKTIADTRWDLLKNAFDLQAKPLFNIVCMKTSESTCTLLLVFHHIIEDGWCLPIIQNDFFTMLASAMEGKAIAVESAGDGRYEKYVRGICMKDKRQPLEYWRTLLEDYETKAVVPSYGTVSEEQRSKKDSLMIDLTAEEQQMMETLCGVAQVTPNTIVETAWGLLLQRYNRNNDAVFAKVVSGRDNSDSDVSDIMGIFINTVPVRVRVDDGDTVLDVLKKVQAQAAETNCYDYLSLSEVQQQSELGKDLFQSIVVFENYPSEEQAQPWPFTIKPIITKEENFDDISLTAYVGKGGQLALQLQFNNELYTEQEMAGTLEALHHLVRGMLVNTDAKVTSLPLLDAENEEKIVDLSAGKRMETDSTKTFVQLFEACAKQAPNHVAVVDQAGQLTYGELSSLTSVLAQRLIEAGVQPNHFVSIMLGYQKEFLVAAIGIEKSGGAYVPLDYDYPNDRLLYMLEDSESQVLITSHAIFDEKNADGEFSQGKGVWKILFIDDFMSEMQSQQAATPKAIDLSRPDGLAYMIYTSGSTGKPKGVMIPHRAKANFVTFIAREWGHTEKSRICCHSSFSFDASIEDLYPVLTVGGTLYTVPQEARKDLSLLHDFIVDNGITGGCYTTQLGQMLLQQYPDLPVDYLVVGGEKMTAAPECKCRLINTYGPTEFTVDATFYDVKPGKHYKNIPIGRPLYNLSAYVVDAYGHLMPQGEAGELCMAGIQMAAGYWKRDDLTAQVFSEITVEGQQVKVYHTGDLVRYNDQGDIEYLGRIDSQVKLRGFRIELGEIETLIGKYPGILMESVQVNEVAGVQHLCAYYTASGSIDADALKAFLAESLTDYMVPTAYMQLDEMPLTPNGKISTKLLPVPEIKTEEIVPPETETEKMLWNIVSETLKTKDFGVTTSLSLIGMTSLVAMRLAMSIQKEQSAQVPVSELLKEPTVKAIAAKIDEQKKQEEAAMSMFTKRKNPTSSSEQKADPFAGKKADPFGAKKTDPFGEKKADPFGEKKADPFAANKKKNPFE